MQYQAWALGACSEAGWAWSEGGGCPAALHQAGHIPSLGLLAHLQDGASHRTERDPHGPHAQQRTHIHNIRKCKELQKEKDGQRNRKVGGGNTRREA